MQVFERDSDAADKARAFVALRDRYFVRTLQLNPVTSTYLGGDAYEFKPKFYDFPTYWLNRKGTYYWQAFRVACTKRDCRQEGKVVRFRVG